jgi:hypothetical protein
MINMEESLSYKSTMRRINEKFKSVYAKYKFKLSDANKLKRVKWCDDHMKWRDWKCE